MVFVRGKESRINAKITIEVEQPNSLVPKVTTKAFPRNSLHLLIMDNEVYVIIMRVNKKVPLQYADNLSKGPSDFCEEDNRGFWGKKHGFGIRQISVQIRTSPGIAHSRCCPFQANVLMPVSPVS